MKPSKRAEKRGNITRQRNPIILFATEGKNRTEEIYFSNYRVRGGPKLIPADRHVTDPVNMMDNLIRQAKQLGLSFEDGDRAFCIIDTDANPAKQDKIDLAAGKQTRLVQLITSTPCFEEWFLCHYRYSTGPLTSPEAVKKMESEYPGYEKNKNIFPQIQQYTKRAIENAKKLEAYHLNDGKRIQSVDSNPSTEVYKVVEFVLSQDKYNN